MNLLVNYAAAEAGEGYGPAKIKWKRTDGFIQSRGVIIAIHDHSLKSFIPCFSLVSDCTMRIASFRVMKKRSSNSLFTLRIPLLLNRLIF